MKRFTIEELEPVQMLYDRGLYLQAYKAASELAPLEEWSGGEARILAGRLAHQLGAPRLGLWHHLLAFREEPQAPAVKLNYILYILNRRGPYAAWRLLGKLGDFQDFTPKLQSDWFAAHAIVASILRDFDTAESWLARAESLPELSPWISVVHAGVLQFEDRYEEALEHVRQVLSERAWYRPAVELVAQLQVLLNRDEEALTFLADADSHIECASIVGQQINILIEHQRYSEAWDRLERLLELLPLLEQKIAEATAGLKSNIAYFLNDFATAIDFGLESGNEFYKQVAGRLADPAQEGGRRVILPLAFVRQHHNTCGPATLTMIGRYWNQAVEHLEIVDQICYDGTTTYNERRWAEENGWQVREFTETEESIIKLVDSGIPFTLTTRQPGNGHLQAVIGYDSRRGTVLIRDPFVSQIGEALIDKLLQNQAATGPRGMALVPSDKSELLDSLVLPDEELWQMLHYLNGALENYRWPEAERIYQDMVRQDPAHRLTKDAGLRLAIYDANPVIILSAVESLLQDYPDDQNLALIRLSSLSELGRRDELLSSYDEICGREDIHPILLQQYAKEIAVEAHGRERAIRLLRRAIRMAPQIADSYFTLADILASKGNFDDALELFRFASCLRDKNEGFARSYFTASLFASRSERALEYLIKRWERFGKRSSLSAGTLAWAYGRLDRWQEALEVLDEALALHPDDGELMLEAADLLRQTKQNQDARVDSLLAMARDKAPRHQWLRTAAKRAVDQGRPALALEHWLELLNIQPLAIDAHEAVVSLLASSQGDQAALDHIKAYTKRFAHNYPLHMLLVNRRREIGPNESYLDAARVLVDLAPQNDIGLGYLGEALLRNEQYDEAFDVFEMALKLNPTNRFAGLMLFDLQLGKGELNAAAETLKILEQHLDDPLVIAKSVELAIKQKDDELVKVRLEKLCVTEGDDGHALSQLITRMIESGATKNIYTVLNEAIERPDAIQTVGWEWMRCCLVLNQLECVMRLKKLSRMGAAGENAVECYITQLLNKGEQDVLSQFIELNGGWLREKSTTWSYVTNALQYIGKNKKAMQWIQGWKGQQGLEPWMLVAPAELLWTTGRTDEMVEVIEYALQLPTDRLTPALKLLQAGWMVLSGEPEEGQKKLGLVDPKKLVPWHQPTYPLVSAAVAISLAAEPDRWQIFQGLRYATQNAVQDAVALQDFPSSRLGIYRQLIKHIGHGVSDIRSWLWCYWMLVRLYQLRGFFSLQRLWKRN